MFIQLQVYLVRAPAPAEGSLVTEVFNVKAVNDLVLWHPLLAVYAGAGLLQLGEEVDKGGYNYVKEGDQEENERYKLQPLTTCQIVEPPKGAWEG